MMNDSITISSFLVSFVLVPCVSIDRGTVTLILDPLCSRRKWDSSQNRAAGTSTALLDLTKTHAPAVDSCGSSTIEPQNDSIASTRYLMITIADVPRNAYEKITHLIMVCTKRRTAFSPDKVSCNESLYQPGLFRTEKYWISCQRLRPRPEKQLRSCR